MLKKIILIENEIDYQCDTIEDVVKKIISENYYNFSPEEKKEKLKMLAIANSLVNKFDTIEDARKCKDIDLDKKFILIDEMTYIFSLLMTNKVILLEQKDANIFTKHLNIPKIKENYIIVNKFAKELLQRYIEEMNV